MSERPSTAGCIPLSRRCSRRLFPNTPMLLTWSRSTPTTFGPLRSGSSSSTQCLAASRSHGCTITVKSRRLRPWPKTPMSQTSLCCSGLRSDTSHSCVLQLLSEPTDMAWQPCDVDVGDGHNARTAQVAGEDAQLIQVGDDAASTPFLQAKENLGLHCRRQSPHDDR